MMLAKANADADESNTDRVVASAQEEIRRLSRGRDAPQPESTSSISSGLSIVGKIIGRGALTIFGHVEGELRASSVVIAEGAQMEGDVVAEELTINGHVKGTVHANRVRLGGTGVVEGDILHQTLAIEENARFEGNSRRSENAIDSTSLARANGKGLADVRLAFFGVGATPMRAKKAEAALASGDVDAAIAALDLDPADDVQATGGVKKHLAGVLLRRVAKQLMEPRR